MTNPIQQQPGQTFNSIDSGIITTNASFSGSGSTNTSTSVTGLSPALGSAFNKGSLVSLSADGHAPDYLASAASSGATSLTIGTAASGSASVTVEVFQFPALISGEASAVASTDTLESSYYVGAEGSGGVVCQNDFNQAAYGDLVFIAGGAFTPSAGGYLLGWFLRSYDGGATFEKVVSNTALPRSPDFVIPLFASAYAAGDRAYALDVNLPATPFKTLIQNEAGVAMPSTWGIWLLPEGLQLST